MPRIQEAVLQGAASVLEISKQYCPVDTGRLVSSGGAVVEWAGQKVVGTVEYSAPYAAYVEFGTGARGAASSGAGPYDYRMDWPGMVAQPYLRPALDQGRPAILEAFADQGFKV